MCKKIQRGFGFIVMCCLFYAPNGSANHINCNQDEYLSKVLVTHVAKQDGSDWAELNPAAPASACLGVYPGNDDVSQLGENRGIRDIGFLNDTNFFGPDGAFLEESDLLDIDGIGGANDPGWIFVGKIGDSTQNGIISKGGVSYNFDISSILSLSNCKNKEGNTTSCSGNAVSGEWLYQPPQYNPQSLLNILGADKFFDQAAIVFKSGNSFAVYNFTLNSLGLPPVIGTADENFKFKGTWDMSQLLISNGGQAAGLSHISFWLRDPYPKGPAGSIPEPSSLVLIATIGLLGLVFVNRYKKPSVAFHFI